MNEMNPLEKQLRSWSPRRPSPRLRRRLFSGSAPVARPAGALFWLGPVTACLLFVCVVVSQQSPVGISSTARPDALVTVILSNQSYAAYLPGSFQRAANRLDTFEWTNQGHSPSFMGSLSPGRTNN